MSRRIVSASGAFERATWRLSGAGVRTVLFDDAGEIEADGAIFLAFTREDADAAAGAAFLAAPASAPLEVKMLCSYVSNLDGEDAALEMADLIMMAKGA